MARRKKNDVFVIGDESLDAETQILPVPERETPTGNQEPGGPPPPGLGRPTAQGRSRSARWLAALGIGAAAVGTLATLELSSSGTGEHSQDEASARSALVLRPAPSAADPPTQAGPPLPVRRDNQPGRPRPQHRPVGETEREPPEPTAPESSPTPTVPLPVAEPTPAPAPPSPPPSSSGGGPGGVEQFGFER